MRCSACIAPVGAQRPRFGIWPVGGVFGLDQMVEAGADARVLTGARQRWLALHCASEGCSGSPSRSEGLRQCVLNGAATRTCQVGDELIIAARQWMDPIQIGTISIPVLVFDLSNHVTSQLTYRVVPDMKSIFAITKS